MKVDQRKTDAREGRSRKAGKQFWWEEKRCSDHLNRPRMECLRGGGAGGVGCDKKVDGEVSPGMGPGELEVGKDIVD